MRHGIGRQILGVAKTALIVAIVVGVFALIVSRNINNENVKILNDQRYEVERLSDEISRLESDNSWLHDALLSLGWKPLDPTKMAVRRNAVADFKAIERDSNLWNKRQVIDKYLADMLSGTSASSLISWFSRHTLPDPEGTDDIDLVNRYWEALRDIGIISVIVVGNTDFAGETFAQSNDCWLLIFYKDWYENGWDKTKPLGAVIVKPTPQQDFTLLITSDVSSYQDVSLQYYEGYYYTSPDELKADMVKR